MDANLKAAMERLRTVQRLNEVSFPPCHYGPADVAAVLDALDRLLAPPPDGPAVAAAISELTPCLGLHYGDPEHAALDCSLCVLAGVCGRIDETASAARDLAIREVGKTARELGQELGRWQALHAEEKARSSALAQKVEALEWLRESENFMHYHAWPNWWTIQCTNAICELANIISAARVAAAGGEE